MKILKVNELKLDLIYEALSKGGLVVMPTETVYGLFADATNPKAIEKLNKYKKRPYGKPYSVAVSDKAMATKYVYLNKTAKDLYKRFLPGPLTIVSKSKGYVAQGVESEDKTLGIRIPNHKLVLDVIKNFGKPLTATSANTSYQKRPYKIDDILNNISAKQRLLIDIVVDAGELPKNEPSTVIDTTLDDPLVLRQGETVFIKSNSATSHSTSDTMNLAKELYCKYYSQKGKRAIVFALTGEMGSGKTVFTKGLGIALSVKSNIKSPTFDLEHRYKGNNNLNLIHIDAWRMKNSSELDNLKLKQSINRNSVVAIEWADRVVDSIKRLEEDAIIIWIKIEYGKKETQRLISWKII